MSSNFNLERLLSDKRVIDEINRHLWIESEKAGHNIGFEKAKEDWLKKFSATWMSYNMPEALKEQKPSVSPIIQKAAAPSAPASPKASAPAAPKRRRAKSYLI